MRPLPSAAAPLLYVALLATADCHAATLHQTHKLLPNVGGAGDSFATTVAIDNGVVIVGSHRDDDYGGDSGAAYLYDAATGARLAKITPDGISANHYFGIAVSISNGVALATSIFDSNSGQSGSGSAYLFNTTTGSQLGKLLPDNSEEYDYFGTSATIDDRHALIGAQQHNFSSGLIYNSLHLFDTVKGVYLARLIPDNSNPLDYFGSSLDIDDGVAVVGAIWDDDNGRDSGSAYLFDLVTGTQLAKLTPNDGSPLDEFGASVALDDGIALIGAQRGHYLGAGSGSAYLFDVPTGTELAKLSPNDGAVGDNFGQSVAIDNGLALIGAPGDSENGPLSGSAYLFDIATGSQLAKLIPDDSADGDRFGGSVAIEGGIAIVGSHRDDDNGEDSGAAYVFDISEFTVPEPTAGLLAAVAGLALAAARRR